MPDVSQGQKRPLRASAPRGRGSRPQPPHRPLALAPLGGQFVGWQEIVSRLRGTERPVDVVRRKS
jgi:hypothetical protein